MHHGRNCTLSVALSVCTQKSRNFVWSATRREGGRVAAGGNDMSCAAINCVAFLTHCIYTGSIQVHSIVS